MKTKEKNKPTRAQLAKARAELAASGGRAAQAKMTPEERSARGVAAAEARWGKKKTKVKRIRLKKNADISR